MDEMLVKLELFKACKHFVENRAQTIHEIISSCQYALQSETKSSAGDKHETGRAMLQLEMEKALQQLVSIEQMQAVLYKINIEIIPVTAALGSVVRTSLGNYFLAIGMGKIEMDKNEYYAVSTSSPIGKILLGKKAGETVIFNEKKLIIENIF